ncbi:MAG: hypothetical protein O8C68_03330, partial [Candidatus Methanoperedens sp.]|nr:hypothetical protein [Candidatus Methanoperedens sp.]
MVLIKEIGENVTPFLTISLTTHFCGIPPLAWYNPTLFEPNEQPNISSSSILFYSNIYILYHYDHYNNKSSIQKRVDMEKVVLWMKSCPLGYRLVANKIMMCCRNDFILQND